MSWKCCVLILLVVTQPGCALWNSSTKYCRSTWRKIKANAYDSSDPSNQISGEYDYIGKSFRGPLESENDPLKKYLYSPKHLEIERNLGIGE